MPHRQTDTVSLSARDYIASGLRYGFSREALLRALQEVAPCDARAETDVLPPDHYLVPLSYDPLPSLSELEKEFGKGNVSSVFDGRAWHKHPSCAKMDVTPGKRVMFVKHFAKRMTSEQAIAWGEEHGYRPGIEKEALALARANPDLQTKFWIVALGSFAVSGDSRCVAMLFGSDGGRILDGSWFDGEWSGDYRFLFVRKS